MKYDLRNKETVGMARLADFFLVLTLLFVLFASETNLYGTKKIDTGKPPEQSAEQSKVDSSCKAKETCKDEGKPSTQKK